jgi:hypothetical protein
MALDRLKEMHPDFDYELEYLQKLKERADSRRVSFVVDGEKLYGMFYGYPLVRECAESVCLIRCDNGEFYVVKEKDVKWNDKREM